MPEVLLKSESSPTPDQGTAVIDRLCRGLGLAGGGLVDDAGQWHAVGSAGIPAAMPPLRRSSFVLPDTGTAPGFLLGARLAASRIVPALSLVLWDHERRHDAEAYRLLAATQDMLASVALQRLHSMAEHNRILFERASATARIGVWVCTLPEESLVWTNGVYDLFELPRGSAVERSAILAMYEPASREKLQELRSRAIADHSDFTLDAQITTAQGNQRWMRITATVEQEGGKARRIFGMKQDITEEKLLVDRTRYLAEFDVMTGLANRAQFQARLADLDGRQHGSAVGALLLIDVDNFKAINDNHGHARGDQCLLETAHRLRACCPDAALVARIGGDEFAVLLDPTASIHAETAAERIVSSMRQPMPLGRAGLATGASVGLAYRNGQSAEALFRQADMALYAAKSAGRDRWRSHQDLGPRLTA